MSLLYGSRHAVSGRVLIRTAFDFDDSIYIYIWKRGLRQGACTANLRSRCLTGLVLVGKRRDASKAHYYRRAFFP